MGDRYDRLFYLEKHVQAENTKRVTLPFTGSVTQGGQSVTFVTLLPVASFFESTNERPEMHDSGPSSR